MYLGHWTLEVHVSTEDFMIQLVLNHKKGKQSCRDNPANPQWIMFGEVDQTVDKYLKCKG